MPNVCWKKHYYSVKTTEKKANFSIMEMEMFTMSDSTFQRTFEKEYPLCLPSTFLFTFAQCKNL